MYTYLNQRYGLKNLIIEWAAAIINGIKMFQKDDHDVALFGKILRSECDEEFRFIQQTVKETVIALLRALYREKYPSKPEQTLSSMVDSVLTGKTFVENWQWRKIIEKMYDDEDYRVLEHQLAQKIQSQMVSQPLSARQGQFGNRTRSSSTNQLQSSSAAAKRGVNRGQTLA